jgi:hypothetical protein
MISLGKSFSLLSPRCSFNNFSLLSLPPAVGEGFRSPIQHSTLTKLITPHEFETAKTTFEEKARGSVM